MPAGLLLLLAAAACEPFYHDGGAPRLEARGPALHELLPPPPANDSPATRAELDRLLRLQAARTPEQVARARADVVMELDSFSAALGLASAARSLPLTESLLESVRRAEEVLVRPAKRAFERPRPYRLEPRIEPCVERPFTDSYPSGHAAWGYAAAHVLAALVPERRAALLVRAAEFAHSRLLAGVHYPSDLQAGQRAGEILAARLLAQPDFARSAGAARRELRAALGLPDS